MATLDVAMIPFKLTKLIEATSPVKLYEYLAAGLPVVATPMPEVVPFAEGGVVMCRETVKGFAEAVLELRSNGRPMRCQEIAKDHSWGARFEKALAGIVSKGGWMLNKKGLVPCAPD
jgi:glycosyltransferase involved in cell wall biosynthesis